MKKLRKYYKKNKDKKEKMVISGRMYNVFISP